MADDFALASRVRATRRLRLAGPLMRMGFAASELHELRKSGSAVAPDAAQRQQIEDVITELQYWRDYDG